MGVYGMKNIVFVENVIDLKDGLLLVLIIYIKLNDDFLFVLKVFVVDKYIGEIVVYKLFIYWGKEVYGRMKI